MCGICGIINFNYLPVCEIAIRNMMHIMKHRGPDDEGIFIENNFGLGFVRLSIIDLSSAGHQPMHSQDERYVIIFNGEVYNYIELREDLRKFGHSFKTGTDTEVVLAAYRQWGEECMNHFNGMWALVIFDRENKKVFAARDRFGIKPFYYLQTDDYFAFASEIPPLLSLLDSKPKPNYQSIFDYLIFSRTDQTEDTFFTEVKKLQHGYCLKIDTYGTIFSKWYDLRHQVKNTEGFKSPDEFRELFRSSISLRLRSDVPVGVCLSGGLDSSCIVSVLLKDFDKKELNTFSAVYNKGQIGDETEFIEEYKTLLSNMFYITPDAKSLEKDLFHFILAHGEPIPSTSPYAQFKVMELAQGKVVVTLDGQGADEELAGYHYFFGFFFKDLFIKGHIIKLVCEMFYYFAKHHSLYGMKSFLFFLLPSNVMTETRLAEKGYINQLFVKKYKKTTSITSNLFGARNLSDALLNHFEYKLEHLLKWEDRNSMWFSLESRVPFLDYRLVERTLASSSDMIIQKGMTKHLLREAIKNILPDKIYRRKDKVGFGTPQDMWFKSPEWQKIILEILNSSSFKDRNIFDIEKVITQYNSYLLGKANFSKEIWKCVHLELWFRTFID